MEGFLTFLLFFVLFIWIARRIFPYLIVRWIKKRVGGVASNMEFQSERRDREEGEVFVKGVRPEKKVMNEKIGEYTDFEEIN